MVETFIAWVGLDPTPETIQGLSAWVMHPYYIDGQLCAVAAMTGSEIHFAAHPDWRGRLITRRRAREFLAPMLEDHGFLTTRVAPPNCQHHAFLTRLGFERTWGNGITDHYMLSELPFSQRTKPCPCFSP
jgi:hypothetical protein